MQDFKAAQPNHFLLPIGGRHQAGQLGPYQWREGLGLVLRNLLGPSLANPAAIEFMPKDIQLNEIEPSLRLGVGGDVMMMFGREWQVDASLKDFFVDCDALLLNMEGVITDKPKKGPDQKHDTAIISQLSRLFDPHKTWLSMANNHSADFGHADFEQSLQQFEQQGFHCFGLAERPYADIANTVRVVGATQWSNKPCDYMYWLDQAPEQWIAPDRLNLLFPHWSYEMECYPRLSAVTQMQHWLGRFDAVVGSHSHTPQPVSIVEQQANYRQLAAYSLGDFCFGLGLKQWPALKHYPYGIVLKLEIGRLTQQPERFAIGRVQWSFVDCAAQPDGKSYVSRLVEHIPYFK